MSAMAVGGYAVGLAVGHAKIQTIEDLDDEPAAVQAYAQEYKRLLKGP